MMSADLVAVVKDSKSGKYRRMISRHCRRGGRFVTHRYACGLAASKISPTRMEKPGRTGPPSKTSFCVFVLKLSGSVNTETVRDFGSTIHTRITPASK